MRTHLVIPDTQVDPGVPTTHLGWIGQYILDQFRGEDLAVIHLGDHWNMGSLSTWDKKAQQEGRRVCEDLRAGDEALALIREPTIRYNERCKETGHHGRQWEPEWWFLMGNHEDRFDRWLLDHPEFIGMFGMKFDTTGWNVIPFRKVLTLDGVNYSHYFYNPRTGRPYSGANIQTRLNTIGASFTMGHQQGLAHGSRSVMGKRQRGLVAGSCYLHDEEYLGPQGQADWNGIVVCHEVHDGSYDLMEVSLDFLCRKYEGKSLAKWMKQ